MDFKGIIKLIEDHKKIKYYGREYYFYKPKETTDGNYIYYKGEIFDKNKVDKNIYTNWFKFLVKQKKSYSLAKPVTVKKGIPMEFNIEAIIDQMVLNASIDSKSWLHLYINQNNRLDWIIVNDKQIIPVYDEYKKYILQIIKFWPDVDNKDITHVEVWNNENCIEFDYKTDKEFNVSPRPHYLQVLKYQDKEEEVNPMNFGFVPFIPLYNNTDKESDIEDIHELLDVYNDVCTGFVTNVKKFQDALIKLKGFGAGQDFDAFMKQLKKYGVIPIPEDGDMEYLKIEIPVEARKVILEIMTKNIFILGRGVDPNIDFGGSNITNVLIKSIYSGLDEKASDTEKQVRVFFRQLILILNMYYGLALDDEIVFNRTQLFNESEQIDNCLKSMGLVSIQTILSNHPWISDVKKELVQLENENKTNMNMSETNNFVA